MVPMQGQLRMAEGGERLSARPGGRWAGFLSGLPHLLMGLVMAGPMLLNAAGWSALQGTGWVTLGPMGVLALAAMGVLVYSLRNGWDRWTASWLFYMIFLPLVLLFAWVNNLSENARSWSPTLYLLGLLAFSLGSAFILYRITCGDRVRGLLAVIPLLMLPWLFFQEFVPDLLRGLAWLWISALAFAVASILARTRRFNLGLGLALLVPVLGGLPFSMLSVYKGGSLPFSEPGPSLRVVFEQFIPFLAGISTLMLGPLLAAKLRELGKQSSLAAARFGLGGLLWAMCTVVAFFGLASNSWDLSPWMLAHKIGLIYALTGAVGLGEVIYLVGLGLMLRAAFENGAIASERTPSLKLTLIFLALPGLPLALAGMVASIFGGNSFISLPLILLFDLAWFAGAVWALTD